LETRNFLFSQKLRVFHESFFSFSGRGRYSSSSFVMFQSRLSTTIPVLRMLFFEILFIWTFGLTKRNISNSLKIVYWSAKIRFSIFWAPFWNFTPSSMSVLKLHPKNESSAAEDVVTEEYLLLQMNLFFWCRWLIFCRRWISSSGCDFLLAQNIFLLAQKIYLLLNSDIFIKSSQAEHISPIDEDILLEA
jgi:hypothetical protein